MLDGAAERERRDHNDRAWLAWNTAHLHRVKRMAPLKDLVIRGKVARPPQTMDEQIAIAGQWLAVSSDVQRG